MGSGEVWAREQRSDVSRSHDQATVCGGVLHDLLCISCALCQLDIRLQEEFMAQPFPYTYYACPCVNTAAPLPILTAHQNRKASREAPPINIDSSDEEDTFDSRSPRANFSLFPLEYLLWCTECHQMRCARCMADEVVCWYCPTCLFEVPSSTVRSEGNRYYFRIHVESASNYLC
jgi:Dynactin p62 family